MNKIYKIIRRKFSDEAVVVSELVKGQGVLSRTRRKKKLMRQVMSLLLFSGMGNSALAEEWVDGSVYGSLSHQTDITSSQDNSNNPISWDNSAHIGAALSDEFVEVTQGVVSIGDGKTVSGNVYGGSASVVAQAGDAKAGNADAGVKFDSYANASTMAVASFSNATATENNVTVGESGVVSGSLYGGSASVIARGGDATGGNSTTTTSTTFSYAHANISTFADASESVVTASENHVGIGKDASVSGSLYGGSANVVAQAGNAIAGNAVAVSTTNDARANAHIDASVATDNSVVTANSNRVTVSDSVSISGSVYGGSASLIALGGNALAGNADASSPIDAVAYAISDTDARSSSSTVTANGNVVILEESASITGSLYGGSANMVVKAGNATASNVTSDNTASASAYAYAFVYDSIVTANDNKVTVGDRSDLRNDIYGGYAGLTVGSGTAIAGTFNGNLESANAVADASGTKVLANNNEVNMNGSLNGGSIYGGYVQFNASHGAITGNEFSRNNVYLNDSIAKAVDNTVTLETNAQINSPSGSLYGGYLEYNPEFAPENYDVFSGNTLNFLAKTPAFVQNVGNFEYYNFTINPNYANTNTALISAENISFGANTGNMDAAHQNGQTSKIKVVGIHSGNILNAGDQFLLMSASNSLTGIGTGETSTGIAQQGISLLYDVKTTVDSTNKKVTATILGDNETFPDETLPVVRVNPQLKSLAEGYLLGSQLVTRGADLIADDAYRAIQEQNPQGGWSPFVVLSGQHTRYNSGSHIKSNDFLMAGGLSYQQNNWIAGAFLEGGWGSYDSYNSFSQVSDVHGTGNDRYYGLGLLGRYQLTSGFYSEASVRFGRNRTKFDTNDIQNFATGEFAHYNLTNNYLSGHVGVGYLVPLTEKNELDISAKYLYTTLSGKSATIGGDRIDFDRVDSNRIRLGIQLNHQYSKTVTLQSGLAYEYEFDGKAGANTYGMSIGDAPSLKGSTGILSVGALIKPRANLTVDLKLNGYTGKREGFGANVKMTYLF